MANPNPYTPYNQPPSGATVHCWGVTNADNAQEIIIRVGGVEVAKFTGQGDGIPSPPMSGPASFVMGSGALTIGYSNQGGTNNSVVGNSSINISETAISFNQGSEDAGDRDYNDSVINLSWALPQSR